MTSHLTELVMDRRPKTPAALAAWTGHTAPGIRALLAGAALLLCTGGTAYGQEIEAEACRRETQQTKVCDSSPCHLCNLCTSESYAVHIR